MTAVRDGLEGPSIFAQHRDGVATLWVPNRPALLNAERSKHWRNHRQQTSTDRQHGWVLGARLKANGYRPPTPAVVASRPTYRHRPWPDVGNWLPAVKAVVDGLVDAGWWPDDTAEYVSCLVFDAPRAGDRDGLLLTIAADDDTPVHRIQEATR